MSDLRIDPVTNKTVLPPVFVSGRDLIVQKAVIRLEIFAEEWPFDVEAGIDWFRFTETKEINPDSIATAIISELSKIDGLENVDVTVIDRETYDVSLEFANFANPASLEANLGGPPNVERI